MRCAGRRSALSARGPACSTFPEAALYHQDFDQVGATLHLVTTDLDGGPILRVIKPPLYLPDTEPVLYCRSKVWAIWELVGLLHDYEKGVGIPCWPQPAGGHMYRHQDRTPWRELLFWLRRKRGLLRLPYRPARREHSVQRPAA